MSERQTVLLVEDEKDVLMVNARLFARRGYDVRTVRFHIANLRKKLDADNAPDFDIVSVYGKGYMFTTMR